MTGSEILGAFNATVKHLTPVVCTAVAIGTGFMLWAPTDLLKSMSLLDAREQHKLWLGIAFVVAIAFLIAYLIFAIGKAIGTAIVDGYKKRKAAKEEAENSQKARANKLKILEDLTPIERGYLLPYIKGGLATQRFLADDGIAGGLQSKGIIYLGASVGDAWTGFDFNLQPWARAMLIEHPRLLEDAQGEPRKPQRLW